MLQVERRQGVMSQLAAEKAAAAARASVLRERDDDIATLKLAAMKHAEEAKQQQEKIDAVSE